jgi:hypothetical protein
MELDEFGNIQMTDSEFRDIVKNDSLRVLKEQFIIDNNDLKVASETGIVYDANEKSQNRLSNALATLTEGETIEWVSANNTIHTLSREQVKNILKLAITHQTNLVISYNNSKRVIETTGETI